MEEEGTFQIMLEKPINYSVNSVFWSHTMDLLAIVTQSNSLEVFRMGEKAQKVFQLEEKEPITSIDLSPDSNLLVYGRLDGSVQIVRTQNGEKVFFYDNADDKLGKNKLLGVGGLESVLNQKNKQPRSSIEAVRWVEYLHKTDWDHLVPFTKGFKQNQLILSIAPHPLCDKNALIKIRHLTQNQTNFSLLLSSQRSNTFISLNGLILIATLNYSRINLKDFYILHSTYSNKIYSVISHTPNEMTDLYLVTFQCKQFNAYKDQVVKVNYLMAYAGELLTYIERSYKTICAKVKEIVKSYNNKITISVSQEQTKTTTQAQDMYRLLTLGIPSKDLMQFITKDLYDTPYLQKLDENLTGMFSTLHQLTLESAQNVIQRLVIVLKKLIEMSNLQIFQKLGLDRNLLCSFYQKIKSLYKTGQILLIESTEAKFDIRNLLIWLNKLTIRNMNQVQTQITNIRSDLNKYMVDTTRLRAFLRDQPKFKLEHLLNLCLGNNARTLYQPNYTIHSNDQKLTNPENYQQKLNNFNKILRDLDLPSDEVSMEEEKKSWNQYQSIQSACRQATHLWLNISKQPIQKLNTLIQDGSKLLKVGSIEAESNYLLKIHSHNDFLTLMYTESQFSNKVHCYDCLNDVRTSITCPQEYYVCDISITSSLTLLFLRSTNEMKAPFVGELDPDSFSKGEMIFSKRMEIEGDVCTLSSSEKGLSSILINKNKLVIVQ